MAITKSAKKAMRASDRRRVFNLRGKRAMRSVVKEVRDLATGGKGKEAEKKLPLAYKAIDKAAKRDVIKKNAAGRKKSRLAAFVKKSSEK